VRARNAHHGGRRRRDRGGRRKGEYGNYIRIRHANGYKTAYGHMSRFAQGVSDGIKVRQGQIIGFVGTTGLSSGPHVHFEVLVNNSYVDPMSIQVPRERQLTGKQLADFQKERLRIDELMRRIPSRPGLRRRASGNRRTDTASTCRCAPAISAPRVRSAGKAFAPRPQDRAFGDLVRSADDCFGL